MRRWFLVPLAITLLLVLFPPWRRAGLWQSADGPPSNGTAARYDRFLFGYLPYKYGWVGAEPPVFSSNGSSVDLGDGEYEHFQYTLKIDYVLLIPPIVVVWLPTIACFLLGGMKR